MNGQTILVIYRMLHPPPPAHQRRLNKIAIVKILLSIYIQEVHDIYFGASNLSKNACSQDCQYSIKHIRTLGMVFVIIVKYC